MHDGYIERTGALQRLAASATLDVGAALFYWRVLGLSTPCQRMQRLEPTKDRAPPPPQSRLLAFRLVARPASNKDLLVKLASLRLSRAAWVSLDCWTRPLVRVPSTDHGRRIALLAQAQAPRLRTYRCERV